MAPEPPTELSLFEMTSYDTGLDTDYNTDTDSDTNNDTNIGTEHCLPLCLFSKGEISSDLYRFVQCDIKKCAFDSLKLEQNPQNCDKFMSKQ